ncbi:MAG: glycosyltransferase family 2 protein [Parvularculaceae bacterium]|nr:glycosyltransferase family 2 protein [Parvularculaceae bacterium]
MTAAETAALSPLLARNSCAVGVVVINYKSAGLIRDCVSALGPDLEALDARIAVVDNFSNDGSAEEIDRWLSEGPAWKRRIHIIRSKTNSGFSGGNNQGIAALDARFYLLINSDAIVRPGALHQLLETAAQEKDAGIIAPRLEDPDGTAQVSCFRFHSPLSEFLSAAQTGPLDALFRFAIVPVPVVETRAECQWVSFACILVRREALEAAGPMDEGYFMYFEDADYCARVRRAGFRIVYEPAARVIHLRGGSAPVKALMKAKKRPPAYYYAARTRYFRKWCGPLGPLAANLMWTAGRGVAHLRALFGKPAPVLCEHQGTDHWINWRDPLGDRRAPE